MSPRRTGRERHRRGAAALGALLSVAIAPAWGQVITPGGVLDTTPFRKPLLPPTPPEVIFPAPRPDAVHDPAAPRFTVNSFAFTGSTVFREQLLKRLVERFVDMQLNLYELNLAADAITKFYRDNGFPIARAIIPAQKVENGIVRVEVIEGRIGQVSVAGNDGYREDTILARTANLSRQQLVTIDRLERSLLLINDLPGLSARATLQPGGEYGTTDLLIRAEEKHFSGSLNMDNHGRSETGQVRVDGSFEINNPLRDGDQLSLRYIESRQGLLDFARVAYSAPLMANGLRLGTSYSKVNYRIGGQFAPLGIDGDVANSEVTLTYPYTRSRARNVIMGFGLRHTATSQRTLGVPTTATKLDIASFSLLGSWIHDDSASTNATLIVSGNGKTNTGGGRQDAQAFKFDIDLNHLRAATKKWDLFMRGNLVLARDVLPDTEKFSLGGPFSVRGYRPAELRGDDGWLATAELRRQFVLGNTVGVTTVFFDAGGAKASGFTKFDTLRGAGVGISVFPNRYLRAKVEVARALSDRPSSDGSRTRTWFSIGGSF